MKKDYHANQDNWLVREEGIAFERIKAMKSCKVKGFSLEELIKKARAAIKK